MVQKGTNLTHNPSQELGFLIRTKRTYVYKFSCVVLLWFLAADFIQLLLVCLQWQVFRMERREEAIREGGDNYEATTDVENIAANPVPNFNLKR